MTLVDVATNKVVEEGQGVQIQCSGNTESGETRWWKKQESGAEDRIVLDDEVLFDFEDYMSFNKTTGILTIHNATLNDGGVYGCLIGFDQRYEINLTVLSKSQWQIVAIKTI